MARFSPTRSTDYQQVNFGTSANPDWEWSYGIWFHNDRLTNGVHALQLVSTLKLSFALNDNTPYITMTNPPFSTAINNPIIFQKWTNLIVGTNFTFNAQTTINPSTWQIDLYDQNGSWVNTGTGTTANGNISWTWNLYDSQGTIRDNVEADPYYIPIVTVTPGSGGGASPNPAPVQRQGPASSIDYPYNGGWIVAYQDISQWFPAAHDALMQSFSSLRGGPSLAGLSSAACFLVYGNTNDPDMTTDPVQNMLNRNAAWDNLRYHLTQPLFRNLYVFAHGGGFSIGGDWELFTNSPSGPVPAGSAYDTNKYQTANGPITSTAYLDSGWCYQLSPYTSDAPHPYRFVFMDGCSTATGDWPAPFGIARETNNINYFKGDGSRPNAFVGWNVTVAFANNLGSSQNGWGDYQTFANFRSEWMFNWGNNSQTYALNAALGIAQQNSGWIALSKMNQILSIFGLNELGFNDYNQRTFSFPP